MCIFDMVIIATTCTMKRILSQYFLLILAVGSLQGLKADTGGNDAEVKILYAEGKIFHKEVLINWTTEYENILGDFIIEGSENGKDWRIRGRVRSQARRGGSAEYKFTDTSNDKFRYYRIKRQSKRGWEILSEFEVDDYSINIGMEELLIDKTRKLVLEIEFSQDQEVMIRVYNKIGKQVKTQVLPFQEAGDYIYQLDITDLPRGNYVLQINQVLLDKAVAERRFSVR